MELTPKIHQKYLKSRESNRTSRSVGWALRQDKLERVEQSHSKKLLERDINVK
jgi:hypothetical protein